MEPWVDYAVQYIRSWIEFQMRTTQQPGCIMAVAHRGKVIAEFAFGEANLATGEKLTPRHRFRIASHSKSFTAAGIMKLREQRKLRLDDPVGQYVKGLHPQRRGNHHRAAAVAQRRPHPRRRRRRPVRRPPAVSRREGADGRTAAPPAIEPSTRFKYSNHGFGLLGLVIEAVTREPIAPGSSARSSTAAGLRETEPDMPLPKGSRRSRAATRCGCRLGRRLVVPGDNPAHAMASAAGFVSTAADVARFFAQLAPNAKRSVLSAASRREMTRKQWRNPHASLEGYYGLGTMSGTDRRLGLVRPRRRLPGLHLADLRHPGLRTRRITILTNCHRWLGRALGRRRHAHPARLRHARRADRRVRDWTGRWWSHVGCGRSRADRKPRAGRQRRSCSIPSWMLPRSRSPAATPARSCSASRLPQPRRGGAPHPQQTRRGQRYLARRRQPETGKSLGRGDRAPLRPSQATPGQIARPLPPMFADEVPG